MVATNAASWQTCLFGGTLVRQSRRSGISSGLGVTSRPASVSSSRRRARPTPKLKKRGSRTVCLVHRKDQRSGGAFAMSVRCVMLDLRLLWRRCARFHCLLTWSRHVAWLVRTLDNLNNMNASVRTSDSIAGRLHQSYDISTNTVLCISFSYDTVRCISV